MSGNSFNPGFLWQSRLFGRLGYEAVAQNILHELDRRHFPVAFRHLENEQSISNEVSQSDWYRRIQSNPAVISSPYLVFWTAAGTTGAGFFRECRAMNPGHQPYIGYTMFETDRVHPSWVYAMDGMDEIWVPSHFNLETFTHSGVPREKLRVMPFGIDLSRFDPRAIQPQTPQTGKGFNFLSVFYWSWRKGWDVLIRAYVEEFKAEEDVALTIVSYRGAGSNQALVGSISARIESYVREIGYDPSHIPKIRLVEEMVPHASWPSFYAGHDAFVLPSRGEGWGFPYMEAMAMELPVAGTAWGGSTEFLHEGVAYPIAIDGLQEVGREQVRDNALFAGHRWAVPSVPSLRDQMRRMFEDRTQAKSVGQQARQYLQERFSVQKSVDRIVKRMDELNSAHVPSPMPLQKEASEVQPYRLLWLGADPIADGLSVLLACLLAGARESRGTLLQVAATQQSAESTIRSLVEQFVQRHSVCVEFLGVAESREKRERLLRQVDSLWLNSSSSRESAFCEEAICCETPLVVAEHLVPSCVRNEDCCFLIPGLAIPSGDSSIHDLTYKAYPNVIGALLAWLPKHRDLAKSRAKVALQRWAARKNNTDSLRLFIDRCEPPKEESGTIYSPLFHREECGDLSGAIHREIWRSNEAKLGVLIGTVGQLSEKLDAYQKSQGELVLYYRSSGGALCLFPRSIYDRGHRFPTGFQDVACIMEFVRQLQSKAVTTQCEVDLECLGPQEQAIQHFSKAMRYFGEKQDQMGIEELSSALDWKPDYPEALLYLARQWVESTSPDQLGLAEEALWNVLRQDALHPGARHLLGKLYVQEGEFKKSLEHLTMASKLDPENSLLWNDLGTMRYRMQDIAGAVQAFEKALSLDDKNVAAWSNGADLLVALGKKEQASTWIRKALARMPKDAGLQDRLQELTNIGQKA